MPTGDWDEESQTFSGPVGLLAPSELNEYAEDAEAKRLWHERRMAEHMATMTGIYSGRASHPEGVSHRDNLSQFATEGDFGFHPHKAVNILPADKWGPYPMYENVKRLSTGEVTPSFPRAAVTPEISAGRTWPHGFMAENKGEPMDIAMRLLKASMYFGAGKNADPKGVHQAGREGHEWALDPEAQKIAQDSDLRIRQQTAAMHGVESQELGTMMSHNEWNPMSAWGDESKPPPFTGINLSEYGRRLRDPHQFGGESDPDQREQMAIAHMGETATHEATHEAQRKPLMEAYNEMERDPKANPNLQQFINWDEYGAMTAQVGPQPNPMFYGDYTGQEATQGLMGMHTAVQTGEPMEIAMRLLKDEQPDRENWKNEGYATDTQLHELGLADLERLESHPSPKIRHKALKEQEMRSMETEGNMPYDWEQPAKDLADFYGPQFTNIEEQTLGGEFQPQDSDEFRHHEIAGDIEEVMPGQTFFLPNVRDKYDHLKETTPPHIVEDYTQRMNEYYQDMTSPHVFLGADLPPQYTPDSEPVTSEDIMDEVGRIGEATGTYPGGPVEATGFQHGWQEKLASEPMDIAMRLLKAQLL